MAFRFGTLVAFSAFLIISSSLLADSIDDAEAKRRGVPVQQVQLERFTAQNADLQAKLKIVTAENAALKTQVDQLNAQVAQLKAALTPEAKATLDLQPAIATAIKEHRILNGMTVEQAGQAVGVKFEKMNMGQAAGAPSDASDYRGSNVHQTPLASVAGKTVGGQMVGDIYTLHVQAGKVTSWEKTPYYQQAPTASDLTR